VRLTSQDFDDGGVIPAQFAFCAPDPKSHATLSKNLNPQLAWRDVPMGTRSFALVCHDPDVPSKGDDVNQEGRTVPKSLPRAMSRLDGIAKSRATSSSWIRISTRCRTASLRLSQWSWVIACGLVRVL